MISVIIATYNRAFTIEETLTSISNQTYKDFECIIVDDGSTDTTAQIVSEFVRQDSRFRYVVRPDTVKRGANYSRNYGYSLSKGSYVKFFDSDDIMLQDHLEVSMDYMLKGEYDFVVADCINFDESGLLQRPYEIDREVAKLSAYQFTTFKTAWITNDLLVKREFADQIEFVGGKKDQATEYQYNIKLLLLTENGFLINKILTYRRVHDGGIVVSAKKNLIVYNQMNADTFYVTAKLFQDLAPAKILNWLLSSYIELTFKISTSKKIPENIVGATILLFRFKGLKALLYPLAIMSGYFTKKGYKITKYIRS
ncbi:family 2 glycosyl transferase [Nonlabens sp. YIK11]|uniref:glycosyltransferase family 2 protein n=1 Tax=Nonlabens sp. YIK11 TaxID=1453349 RepID=UPI0006DCC9C2|nr:glycosyltransferase family 2 protein [Nonlabens sp. YIK11]KQC34144.1 family 2 glycosyl transferase [Nonlabens sp. YIK11]